MPRSAAHLRLLAVRSRAPEVLITEGDEELATEEGEELLWGEDD